MKTPSASRSAAKKTRSASAAQKTPKIPDESASEPLTLKVVDEDPWLEPYRPDIEQRSRRFLDTVRALSATWGSLADYASGHLDLGFHHDAARGGWTYREWAPRADGLFLIGDFNAWNRAAHPLERKSDGVWEIFVPDAAGLGHESRVKVHVVSGAGAKDRMPAYIGFTEQDAVSKDFSGKLWHPPAPYAWKDGDFRAGWAGRDNLCIYECHVGMAQEKEGVGTWIEFAEVVLPRIRKGGYNAIQLMAVAEHPYYGSFGYHVSNFFAPSSRFGTPDEFKALVDAAHGMGIAVILDIVHSHAVKNEAEGLSRFDGDEAGYFHAGGRGYHEGWDSRLFDYGKDEVRRFLLSNLRWWIEEFHVDGFRFDGVTSMLYFHHGMYKAFTHYDMYYRQEVDWDAVTYLQLANRLVHDLHPGAVTIAEDMSGMPGTCRPPEEGGMGFDYRLGMGIPDFWIKTLKEKRDEDWDIWELWHVLTNRRWKEKTVAYAESHDQALVGDKTLAFWLMDAEMYWNMAKATPSLVVDRGMALHKMIRLLTAVLGGEAWMTFMGNEFGHPEWIDFPREGNGWSHRHARRQWSLAERPDLRYHQLGDFDRALVRLLRDRKILESDPAHQINMDTHNKSIIAERRNLLFLWNFHAEASIPDYRFAAPPGRWRIVLSTDDAAFGGFGRVDTGRIYETIDTPQGPRLSVYLTSRTGLVFEKLE